MRFFSSTKNKMKLFLLCNILEHMNYSSFSYNNMLLQETTTKDGENYDEKFDLDEEAAEYVNNLPFWLICFDTELRF